MYNKDPEAIPRPIQLLLSNRQSLVDNFGFEEALYTPPSPDHYPHVYLWDSCFSSIVFARYGYTREAVTEVFSVLNGQRPDGFIPNMQFAPVGRENDIERLTFMDPKVSSDYTQPPILAVTAQEAHQAMLDQGDELGAATFLDEAYPRLKRFYDYFARERQNSAEDKLIGNIHPHETGRDSDPTFDFAKLRLPRSGPDTPKLINEFNRASDYASVIFLNMRQRAVGWDVQKARQNFWVNDVMFNCMYADNLYVMSELAAAAGRPEDALETDNLAREVEAQILTKMWLKPPGAARQGFHALLPAGPINEVSISNLFPLVLPNLSRHQLDALLDQIEFDFNPSYPLPSVPTTSRNYDPHNHERDRLWRGSTWTNTNWYLADRGLKRQATRPELSAYLSGECYRKAGAVAASSMMLVKDCFPEFSHPHSAAPQRTGRVRDFAWAATAYIT